MTVANIGPVRLTEQSTPNGIKISISLPHTASFGVTARADLDRRDLEDLRDACARLAEGGRL